MVENTNARNHDPNKPLPALPGDTIILDEAFLHRSESKEVNGILQENEYISHMKNASLIRNFITFIP